MGGVHVPVSPSFTPGEEEDGKERYASGLGSLKANRRKRPRTPEGGEGTKRPAVAPSSAPYPPSLRLHPEEDYTEPVSEQVKDTLRLRKLHGALSPHASPMHWTCKSEGGEDEDEEYGHFAPA